MEVSNSVDASKSRIGRNRRDSNKNRDASNSREVLRHAKATKGTPVEAGGNMKEQDWNF
jgi:hypothetical protein